MKLDHKSMVTVSLALLVWTLALAFWYYAHPAPIVMLGGDLAEPTQVRAGGIVVVSRNFRVVKNEPLHVTREMIKGDCRKACDIVSLPSGGLALEAGEYTNIRREHRIPTHVSPGLWRLVFTIHWQGRLGRYVSAPLPELLIEVVP